MTSLNVATEGLNYLTACLNLYTDHCAFLLFYAVALVFLCIKGDETEKRIFLPSGFLMLLTIYNPLFPIALNSFFDVNSEYYRFFWIAPVVVLVPYVIVKLLREAKIRNRRLLLGAFFVALFIFSGSFLYKNGYQKADNIYKMPEELMEISADIHEDCYKEYTKVFLEYDYNMQMRQYDPKLLLTVDREEYLYAMSSDYSTEMIMDDDHPQYRLLASLIKQQYVEPGAFLSGLELSHTEYVAISRDNPMNDFLVVEAGLEKIAETENNILYHYELQEPYVFELVDYSVVY